MVRSRFVLSGVAGILALGMACSKQAANPASPTPAAATGTDAAADGSTLKATAPVAVSPVNDAQVADAPTLTVSAATLKYGSGVLQYRFLVTNEAGATVADSGPIGATSFRVATALEFKKRYLWRARAEMQGQVGPWSAAASFVSPQGGYIQGSEAFDPLVNGTTVGQAIGPVTFLPNEGVRLETNQSYVRYLIPITMTSGEFSMEVKGLRANAPGDKSKVFGLMQGNPDANDYITNPYRVDVQYRGTAGSPPNSITYRVLYGSADDLNVRYEPTTEQRVASARPLDPNTWYYWRYTWGKQVRVTVQEGGPTGRVLYDVTRNSANGSYNPQPMYAFIGTPTGRSGAESATIPGTIFRNVWISTRPRPQ